METKNINTIEELAEWINSDSFNAIELNRIIKSNGWYLGEKDDEFASDGIKKIVMLDNGTAGIYPVI